MLTEYDIQRVSSAIVEKLVDDDRFIKRMAKLMQRQKRNLISSSQAARILGVTKKTVCQIAEQIGGFRGCGESAHWMFEEEGLIDRYKDYKAKNQ
jgi:hypothetical protein